MGLITEQIPNMINGVSQQPPTLRLASQCEAQENCLVTLSEGLKKRPPTEHVLKINSFTDDLAYCHTIHRDNDSQFKIVVTSKQFDDSFSSDFTKPAIDIIDLVNESALTVNGFEDSDILAYLTSFNPRDTLRMLSIADTTFILNKDIKTAKTSTKSTSRDPEGIFFLKQATASVSLKIFVDGVQISSQSNADAEVIVDGWVSDLESNLGSTFTITKIEQSNVHIKRIDGGDFTMHAEGPEANVMAIKDEIDDFTNLPARTKDGFIVKVTGDPGSTSDDYWVKHENQGEETPGLWVETVEPNIDIEIDNTTMPIKLVKNPSDMWDSAFSSDFGVNDFSLNLISYSKRLVGDESTNKDPGFLGSTITDIFFHRNRFGFLSEEKVILSEIGEYFNFFLTTVTDLLDSDPFEKTSPSDDVSLLQSAHPFEGDLLIYSDHSQFKLRPTSTAGLTPSSTELEEISRYDHEPKARPVLVGRKVYHSENRDGFATVREFGIVEDLQEETAEEITNHITSYIKGNITRIIPSLTNNLLFVFSDDDINEVYIYKFLFERGVKQLSSWGKWKFDSTGETVPIDVGVINSVAYWVIKHPDGTYLEKMTLQDNNLIDITASSTTIGFKPLLDRLTEVTGSYNSSTNKTTWTLPYDESGHTFRIIFGPAFSGKEGGVVVEKEPDTVTTITATGDHSKGFCYMGRKYTQLYEFTEPTIKTQDSIGRTLSLAGGRLKMKKFGVRYFKTGYFEMEIIPPSRSTSSYKFSGRVISETDNIIGTVNFATGEFKKLIPYDARKLKIRLKNATHLHSAFVSAYWEGDYTTKTANLSRRR